MLGDCLERMKEIPDGSVDMILADPPYGTTNCKWDTVIPFDAMWKELKRIIKMNGAILLFGDEPFSSVLRISNIKNFRYDWYWEKPKGTGFLNAKKMPIKHIEKIHVFYKMLPNYFPQMTINHKPQRPSGKNYIASPIYRSVKKSDNSTAFSTTRYPRNILKFNNVNSQHGQLHPTQKPVDLCEYLIKTYTVEGETVLDFTAGSFTTGVACVNVNRNFIGIELDNNYFDIGVNRIKERIACLNLETELTISMGG